MYVIALTELCLQESAYLFIVVDDGNVIGGPLANPAWLVGIGDEKGVLRLFSMGIEVIAVHKLVLRQVSAAQGQTDYKLCPLAVGAVVCTDGTMMQGYYLLCQVQADTIAHLSGGRAGTRLIEPLKNLAQLLFVDARSVVLDRQFCHSVCCLTHGDSNLAVVVHILDGIADEIGHHLVEVFAVYPHLQVGGLVAEGQPQLSLLGLIIVIVTDIVDEIAQRGFSVVQFHLSLLHFADGENLVGQRQQAVGVALDVAQSTGGRRVVTGAEQFVDRPLDECQRRTKFVADVHEEAYLLLVSLCLPTVPVVAPPERRYAEKG